MALMLAVFGFGAKVGAMLMMGPERYEGKSADLVALLPDKAEALAPLFTPDAASIWCVGKMRGLAGKV